MLAPSIDTSKTGSAAAAGTAKSNNARQDMGNKDIFLKLLVAQMQHQDPLKPQDPTQMSSQLAQFNMVEQQNKTNAFLEQLIKAQPANTSNAPVAAGASYLGRTALVQQSSIAYSGAPVPMLLNLEAPAAQSGVAILDDQGNTVRYLRLGALPTGSNEFVWDGLDEQGARVAPGTYTLKPAAFDIGALALKANVLQQGIVEAIRYQSDGMQLVINGTPVSFNNIKEVRL